MIKQNKPIRVNKIVSGGYGLGNLPTGKIVLIQGVIPGELVDVQIYKSKKSYDLGFVKAIIEPSIKRVEPRCCLVEQCGGCSLQHLSYSDQVSYKKKIFIDDWTRYFKGEVLLPEVVFLQASQPFSYRQRIRLHVIDGEPCFYRQQSKKPIVVEECLLAKRSINQCLEELDRLAAYQDLSDHINELVLHHNPSTDQCCLQLFFTRKLRPTDQKRVKRLIDSPSIQAVLAYGPSRDLLLTAGDEKEIQFTMLNRHGEFYFTLTPGDFCQINMEQNQEILRVIMDHLEHHPPQNILDLFCGLGNFSIPLAKMGHSITGVDLKRSSIRSAKKNCRLNNVSATFIRKSAQGGVSELLKEGQTFDIILLDPPRAGFKEGAASISQFNPKKIFYIACDQQTQMRDLREIIAGGYKIAQVYLADMFPQTHHLESLVILEAV